MENFFKWMIKPVPQDEVEFWLNMHNMHIEKIELYGDFFKSLNSLITETFLGNGSEETKIFLSDKEKKEHFEWCWNKNIDNFGKENFKFQHQGDHKEYLENFFWDAFYDPKDKSMKDFIPTFIYGVFDMEKVFAKSDLEILTEIYKIFDKNIHNK